MADQSPAELLDHLRDQIHFLVNSCRSFDEGFEEEARRLAVTVRLLVHDTRNSTSLLVQLRRKAGMRFWDTGHPLDPRNLVPDASLVVMRVDAADGKGSVRWLPRCMTPKGEATGGPGPEPRLVEFKTWWDGRVISLIEGADPSVTPRAVEDEGAGSVSVEFSIPVSGGQPSRGAETIFTRRRLVLDLANKDGGAHVDPRLDDDYARLSRIDGLGWKVIDAAGKGSMEATPELATMRQIAHEVLMSLHTGFPDIENEYLPPYLADPVKS